MPFFNIIVPNFMALEIFLVSDVLRLKVDVDLPVFTSSVVVAVALPQVQQYGDLLQPCMQKHTCFPT